MFFKHTFKHASAFCLILVALALNPVSALAGETASVDFNTSSSFKLMKVNYMSRSLARAIVKQRKEQGPFKSPEALLTVPGFTEELLQKMNVQMDDKGNLVSVFEEAVADGMAIPNY